MKRAFAQTRIEGHNIHIENEETDCSVLAESKGISYRLCMIMHTTVVFGKKGERINVLIDTRGNVEARCGEPKLQIDTTCFGTIAGRFTSIPYTGLGRDPKTVMSLLFGVGLIVL